MAMRDKEPWVKIHPLDVAMVAANLMRSGMEVAEATRNALLLIEAATWGLNGLYRMEGLADGVNHWAQVQADRMVQIERQTKLPPDWPDPKAAMMPLERALTLLMPRIKKADRLLYFRQWLAFAQEIDSMAAGDVITLLKKGGFRGNGTRSHAFRCQGGEKSRRANTAARLARRVRNPNIGAGEKNNHLTGVA
jgi:hypothetical protein